jgi:hypothetical protein
VCVCVFARVCVCVCVFARVCMCVIHNIYILGSGQPYTYGQYGVYIYFWFLAKPELSGPGQPSKLTLQEKQAVQSMQQFPGCDCAQANAHSHAHAHTHAHTHTYSEPAHAACMLSCAQKINVM